ncbi:AbiJ-NTD4 domain-containing protein [Rhizobium lemnae]|jgi:AbiJ N-terminal domain 4|uniref:AbiJ-NTD4 domain-containing protein n=2 Tax=Rhizobium lemnae TaxID=1214924 RepID=A0ABV8E6S5_9HYPH
MNRSFSDRHGYRGPEPEITIRDDAPDFLRFQVASIARSCGLSPTAIRTIVCDILLEVPDPRNWSEYPNIWDEVLDLLRGCEWYKVYDVAEAL